MSQWSQDSTGLGSFGTQLWSSSQDQSTESSQGFYNHSPFGGPVGNMEGSQPSLASNSMLSLPSLPSSSTEGRRIRTGTTISSSSSSSSSSNLEASLSKLLRQSNSMHKFSQNTHSAKNAPSLMNAFRPESELLAQKNRHIRTPTGEQQMQLSIRLEGIREDVESLREYQQAQNKKIISLLRHIIQQNEMDDPSQDNCSASAKSSTCCESHPRIVCSSKWQSHGDVNKDLYTGSAVAKNICVETCKSTSLKRKTLSTSSLVEELYEHREDKDKQNDVEEALRDNRDSNDEEEETKLRMIARREILSKKHKTKYKTKRRRL